MHKHSVRFACALFAVLFQFACDRTPTTKTVVEPPAKKAPAEIAASLEPLVQEHGSPGVIPSEIYVEFARPIVDPEHKEKRVHKDTVLKIRPAVAGHLEYQGLSTLIFVPDDGFAPKTTYTAELVSVHTPWGTVKADGKKPWRREFTTPEFKFVSATLTSVELNEQSSAKQASTGEVRMAFTGFISVDEVKKRASWLIENVAPTSVEYSTTSEGHVVLAKLKTAALKSGGTIKLALKAGVPLSYARNYKTEVANVDLVAENLDASRMRVITIERGETPTGHYLDVVCDDDAAPGEKQDAPYSADEGESEYRRYRDRDNGISSRCVLDEESAREKISITPPVKFTVLPARYGFRLRGDFKRGSYVVKVGAGARTIDGGVVRAAYEQEISVPARTAVARFVSSGRYLPRSAWRNLPIYHLNVDAVTLKVRRVPPENMVFWMAGDSEKLGERESNVLLQKTIQLHGDPDVATTTFFDVGSLVPSTTSGVLELSLDAVEAKPASARLVLTNLNLVAKRSAAREGQQPMLLVWSLDMDTGEPLPGIEVKLVRKNGQIDNRCTTGGTHGCELPYPKPGADPAQPFALLAQRGDDITYLKFDDLKTEDEDSDTAGDSYAKRKAYSSAIYSDRGLYRPGETVHLVGVVRDKIYKAPPDEMSVMVWVSDPKSNELRSEFKDLNAAGMWSMEAA